METYRINEDTIKVILGPDDLENRGVTMLDLLGNRKQIESFFYSILEEIDVDNSFANNEAVTFQVMPETKSNGLVLLISKGNTPMDQIKNNFENTQNNTQSEENVDGKDWESFFKENLDINASYPENLEKDNEFNNDTNLNVKKTEKPARNTFETVVKFSDFEDFVMLSEALQIDSLVSNLWLYNDEYYLDLLIFVNDLEDMKLKEVLAIISEYSQKTLVTAAVLSEYGKKIMENSALQTAKHYFK